MIVSPSGNYEMCLSPPQAQQGEPQLLQSEEDVLLPGFRFHPTDEELVGYYLRRMVISRPLQGWITQLDIYKFNPWDLPKMAVGKGEREWYFFCPRDRKYRYSTRPNRVTGSGFWKATGTDRPIYSGDATNCIGLKKSLVFYQGRAPKGIKTDWMMHEFRLPPSNDASSNFNKMLSEESCLLQDAWAVCRIFKKNTLAQRHGSTSQHKMVAESVGRGYQAQAECSSPVDPELDSRSPDRSESSSDDLELDQVGGVCESMMHSQQQQNVCSRQNRQLSRSTWPPSIQKVNSFGDLFDSVAARSSNILCQRSNIADSVYSAACTVDSFLAQDSLAVRGALDFVNSLPNSPQSGPQFMTSMGRDQGVKHSCATVPGSRMTTLATEKFRKKISVQIPQGPLAQPSCGLQPWDIISPIFPLECM